MCVMSEDAYLIALQKARAALVQAVHDRDELNLKILQLQQLVKVLTGATQNEPPGSNETFENVAATIGFTEAVLTILRNSREELTARNIRDRMVALGYELGKYANPLGFIYSVLGRLEAQGKIRQPAPGTYAICNAFYEALLNTKSASTQSSDVVAGGQQVPDNELIGEFVRAFGFGDPVIATDPVPIRIPPPPKLEDKEKSGKK
jgi:hypothetical protein